MGRRPGKEEVREVTRNEIWEEYHQVVAAAAARYQRAEEGAWFEHHRAEAAAAVERERKLAELEEGE